MKKYLVCDSWGKELKSFNSENARTQWLKKYAYFDGVHWIVYNLSRFPYKVSSRALYIGEE
jgi:hypothetical protein